MFTQQFRPWELHDVLAPLYFHVTTPTTDAHREFVGVPFVVVLALKHHVHAKSNDQIFVQGDDEGDHYDRDLARVISYFRPRTAC